jgi:hypothetical protein
MPRPLRAFNKAHSRARIAVERAFGILKMRWRCLHKVVEYKHAAENLQQVTFACVILHNFLMMERAPLTLGETGYLVELLRSAKRRLDISGPDNVRHNYNTVSSMAFPRYTGASEKVGTARRLFLASLLGYQPPVGAAARPSPYKKARVAL